MRRSATLRRFLHLVVAVVSAALLIALTPTEAYAVADIYRDVVDCQHPDHGGDWYCHTATIWAVGVTTSLACHGVTKGMGWFTWGYTWIIGGFYCAVTGTV